MMKNWTLTILLISISLMSILKEFETCKLNKLYSREAYLHLIHFKEAKTKLKNSDQELLELWESILTGRSAPVSGWIKIQYAKLGLNHLFTPSGFHLSALTTPLFCFIKRNQFQFILLIIISVLTYIFNVPSALKRMSLVKVHQKIFGIRFGFLMAFLLDIVTSISNISMISLTYSFLFLGIIYSGEKKGWIVILFFIGQILIAFNQELLISPLILLFSPILNLLFSLAMPFLFLLSWPLNDLQLKLGLSILKALQTCVELMAITIEAFPQFLPDLFSILILFGLLVANKKMILFSLLLSSSVLNLDLQKYPGTSTYEFIPQGPIKEIKDSRFFYSDGTCKRSLIKGFWWEKCSPKRRGSIRKKTTKKLSYL